MGQNQLMKGVKFLKYIKLKRYEILKPKPYELDCTAKKEDEIEYMFLIAEK